MRLYPIKFRDIGRIRLHLVTHLLSLGDRTFPLCCVTHCWTFLKVRFSDLVTMAFFNTFGGGSSAVSSNSRPDHVTDLPDLVTIAFLLRLVAAAVQLAVTVTQIM